MWPPGDTHLWDGSVGGWDKVSKAVVWGTQMNLAHEQTAQILVQSPWMRPQDQIPCLWDISGL